jgi:hypothetical protein
MCIERDLYGVAGKMFDLKSFDGSSNLLRNPVDLHTGLKLLGV